MNKLYYTPREASKYLGVHTQTLRRWEKEGRLKPIRTDQNQRRYTLQDFEKLNLKRTNIKRICYCRVSSNKQKSNLENQINFMKVKFPDYEIITDIASGINFERPGLNKILEYSCQGLIEVLVISYKDRLCRIAYPLIKNIIQRYGEKILVLNNKDRSPEEELIEDLVSITTVFSARMHGLRRYIPEIKKETGRKETGRKEIKTREEKREYKDEKG